MEAPRERWSAALGGFWMGLTAQGLVRCSGLLYAALLEYPDLTDGGLRWRASWPFTLRTAVWNLAGLPISLCSYKWNMRTLLVFGGLSVSLGNILCYFASDFTHIMLAVGLLQGIGHGFIGTLMPVAVTKSFVKNRASGTGIAFSGATLSSFVLPPLIQCWLRTYSLRGTFLLVGGLALNAVVGALLLSPATPGRPKNHCCNEKSYHQKPAQGLDSIAPQKTPFTGPRPLPNGQNLCVKQRKGLIFSIALFIKKDNSQNTFRVSENGKSHYENDSSLNSMVHSQKSSSVISQSPSNSDQNVISRSNRLEPENDKILMVAHGLSIIKEKTFWLISITYVVVFFTYMTYLLVVVDLSDAFWLVSAFSAADLAGRLLTGWVSDLGVARRETVSAVNLALMASNLVATAFLPAHMIAGLAFLAVLLGVHAGSIIIVFFALLQDYLGTERLALSTGIMNFCSGIVVFITPLLAGYVRDTTGTYVQLFLIMGGACGCMCLLWVYQIVRLKKNSQPTAETNMPVCPPVSLSVINISQKSESQRHETNDRIKV